MAEPSTPVKALAKVDSFYKTGAPLRFDSKTGLLKRSKSRKQVKKNINGLCDKPLEKLPLSKDLPRLARNFEVFISDEQQELTRTQSFKEITGWKDLTQHSFIPDPDDDPNEIPKHILLYQLLQVMSQNLPKRDLAKIFPTYEQYEQAVNLDDTVTLNNFLLEHFGEEHEVIRLLKVCHQSVIVNILLGARQALSKHHVQFKDVRGAWRIQVHVPGKNKNYNFEESDSSDDGESDPFLLDLERLKSRYISLGHRRREQVFITFAEWKKQQELLNGEPLSPTKTQTAMKQLFQFEWEVRIFFDPDTFEMKDVSVQLLGLSYKNEDGTVSLERDCAVQQNALIDFFHQYVAQDDDDDDDDSDNKPSPTNASPQTPKVRQSPPASPVAATETTALRPNASSTQPLSFSNILFRLLCWRRRT
jgi:hypothetical protein